MKKLSIILLFLFPFSFFLHCSAQIISTIAGNYAYGAGYSGDEGQATNAELNLPTGINVDDSGNIFIADWANNRIRKIISSTGIITTLAGSSNGYSGDGGPATTAELNTPVQIAFDVFRNIYIADAGNRVIRKITATTGIINTVAGNEYSSLYGDGGPATSAELNGANGIVLDDSCNMYIADGGSSVIRKVSSSSGIIRTIAGIPNVYGYSGDGGLATNAELYDLEGVALDDSDNIYIADSRNEVIRKVTISTGIINTVAGIHITFGGYSGDGGPATAAELRNPLGIFVDHSGNMYIGDNANNVIRMVAEPSGIITTIAGRLPGGYAGDGGPATLAELAAPYGVVLDTLGNLYIADQGNSVIRKVTNNSVTTGVKQWSVVGGELAVYPNPANGQITFHFNKQTNGIIEIYDVMGKLVLNKQFSQTTLFIDCCNFSNGVYFYKLIDYKGNLIKSDKIAVIH